MKLINWIFVILLLTAGCAKDSPPETGTATGKPILYTTFYPSKYFAERIGGDLVDVVCPVPADADAIFWMPDSERIQSYQKADLIILNGADFAKWIRKVSLPGRRTVNTAKPLKERFINYEQTAEHSHGKKGKHAHAGLDGHTWVDPVNAIVQANEIKKALIKRFPEQELEFEKGFSALLEDLNGLDRDLKAYQASDMKQPLLASHPAYNYIARRYGWKIKNLDLDPDTIPSEKVIIEIRTLLGEHPAKFIIWESEPRKEAADLLKKELGLTSIVFSPCELMSEKDLKNGNNYLKVMQRNVLNIGHALSKASAGK